MFSYDANDDLVTPFDNEQLMFDEQEDDDYHSIDYKLLKEGEGKGKSKHKQSSDSNVDINVFSSSKSPLKMVFKKTSNSMITVSPSVTPEPATSSSLAKTSRKESLTDEPLRITESFPPSPQVIFNFDTISDESSTFSEFIVSYECVY